jgi:hypothetical protein
MKCEIIVINYLKTEIAIKKFDVISLPLLFYNKINLLEYTMTMEDIQKKI